MPSNVIEISRELCNLKTVILMKCSPWTLCHLTTFHSIYHITVNHDDVNWHFLIMLFIAIGDPQTPTLTFTLFWKFLLSVSFHCPHDDPQSEYFFFFFFNQCRLQTSWYLSWPMLRGWREGGGPVRESCYLSRGLLVWIIGKSCKQKAHVRCSEERR